MPSVAVDFADSLSRASLDSSTFTKDARLPPRPHKAGSDMMWGPNSSPATCSTSPSSSVAGISIVKPIKAPVSTLQRRKSSFDLMPESPFEAHLEDIYAGRATTDDGLRFFESHGYYDVSDANTVAMFRQNFGMKKQFWDGNARDMMFYEEINLDSVDLAGLQVLSVGSMLSKNVTRHRTVSGRFELLDDDGNVVDPETQLEAEREKRMKLKHLELDDDDVAELAQNQVVLAKAINVIRTEKTRFQKYFFQACRDEAKPAVAPPVVQTAQPMPSLSIQLPPYSGYMYVLKDTIPNLFRSWHKRWLYLDFNTGLLMMYKRSYWKSARGVMDLRTVINITRMNQSDVCLQCSDGRSMLLRSKVGNADADLWMNLLQFALRQVVGMSPTPALQLPPSTSSATMTQITTTTMTTTLSTNSFTSPGGNGFLVSTKMRSQSERSVLDVMAVHLQGTNSNRITAA